MSQKGCLVISLDFELYWGMRDQKLLPEYSDNLSGVASAISAIISIFDRYELHSTWATVGLLMHNNGRDCALNIPKDLPSYIDSTLSPYDYLKKNTVDNHWHFAPDLVAKIISAPNQELASHTFSHFYSLEPGQTVDQFKADLQAQVNIFKRYQQTATSIVFPRNQINNKYLAELAEFNIISYRGDQNLKLYHSSTDNVFLAKLIRFLDSYINLSGHKTYSWSNINDTSPYNIKASSFLRPFNFKLKFMEFLKLRRIKKAMTYAAQNNEIFHLWWHPHNFGINLTENIANLEDIAQHFVKLRRQYGMSSLNMSEVANLKNKDKKC